MPPTTGRRLAALLKRPGVFSLAVLIVAALVPPPGNNSAHLLGLPTLCPLRALTGVPCPGCGITRALCLWAHGRFSEAVTVYHPVVPLVFAGLVAAAGYGLICGKAFPDRVVTGYCVFVSTIMLAIWAARLSGFLPLPPM